MLTHAGHLENERGDQADPIMLNGGGQEHACMQILEPPRHVPQELGRWDKVAHTLVAGDA